MMRRSFALYSFAAFVWAAVASAQQPLGNEFIVADAGIGALEQSGALIACDLANVCGFFWTAFTPTSPTAIIQMWGETLSPDGSVLVRKGLATDRFEIFGVPVALDSGFAVFWDRILPDGHPEPVFQIYDDALNATTPVVALPFHTPDIPADPFSFRETLAVQRIPEGYVVLSPVNQGTPAQQLPGIFLFFIDLGGRLLRDRVQVNGEAPEGYIVPDQRGGLVQDGHGHLIVTYSQRLDGPDGPLDVYVRRFSLSGEPLGPEVRANSFRSGAQGNSQVAASPDGEFLVAWQSAGQDGSSDGIYARRFSAEGRPAGAEFRVNEVTSSAQRFPFVSADPAGNYFVVWSSGHPTSETIGFEVKGRLYRHNGTPVAGEVHLNQDRLSNQVGGRAPFLPNGTLISTWQSGSFRQAGDDAAGIPIARRFSASPGEEICTIDGPAISCDLGRTGGDPELRLTWGGRPGEVTLFGDWDGDGRADLCAFYRGRFRCDLLHNGPPAEAFYSFGLATDTPLLADVDGDHRADPCVRRGADLLCDTRRDGQAHLQIHFGDGSETPLLGDLDGDGKADLCLFENGDWRCHLARGGPDVRFNFGRAGDAPALGDADRDGRADPCVLRAGLLLCDTAHDGGGAELQLPLDAVAGARLLFGNLDGL